MELGGIYKELNLRRLRGEAPTPRKLEEGKTKPDCF